MVELFKNIAVSAVSLLVAALAIYLALKLLGKLAKFVIGVVVVGVLIWLFLTNKEWIMSFFASAEGESLVQTAVSRLQLWRL